MPRTGGDEPMRTVATAPQLGFRTATVAGYRTRYLCGGDGPTVVFLHGWGLTHRTYRRALTHLAAAGVRVYAPTLPGFGRGDPHAADEFSLAGYGRWVAEFIRTVDGPAPVTLVGHSFGGGVAIRTAHDHEGLVGQLVLVNSIGGSVWSEHDGALRAMSERPWWDWGLHLQADLLPLRQLTRVLPVVLRDGVPNAILRPAVLWRAGYLARTADLTAELQRLKQRRLPVVIVWSSHDDVIPAAAIASLRAAAGDPQCVTVPGNHSWLLAEPARFGEVITNVLGLAPGTDGRDASTIDGAA